MSFQALTTGRTLAGGSTGDVPGLHLGANYSTVIGAVAAPTNQGRYNCVIGTDANRQGGNTDAAVVIGFQAGYHLASSGHVLIGNTAAYSLVSGGCNSIMLGSLVGYGTTLADACVYAGFGCARGMQGDLNVCVGAYNNDFLTLGGAASSTPGSGGGTGVTSLGAFSAATGARGLTAGFSNLHATALGGATLGDGCVNTGDGSFVLGSGVLNTGAGSLVLMSGGARCAGYSNNADEALNVQNCLLGRRAALGRYAVELRGDDVTLVATSNGTVRVPGPLACSGGASFSNDLRADRIAVSTVAVSADAGVACSNTGDGSFVLGSGVVNTGANSLVLMSGGARCAGYSNHADEALNVQNCLLGGRAAPVGTAPGRYGVELRGDDISLVAAGDGVVRVHGLLDCTTGESVSNGLRADRLSTTVICVGLETDPQWTIALSNVRTPDGATGKYGDLVLSSKHGTVIDFTDDFVPGLMNFTAQHRCLPAAGGPQDLDAWVGHIVVAAGSYCGLDDTPAITICEAVPVVELSSVARDPRVFGVVAGMEEGGDGDGDGDGGGDGDGDGDGGGDGGRRAFHLGSLRFTVATAGGGGGGGGRRRVMVNSGGEGGVWVCDANGPLRNGDLITSSPHPGLGMRQDDDVVRSCTVAKITADEGFAGRERGSNAFRRAFVGCTYKC
jgi:hypothetical protein